MSIFKTLSIVSSFEAKATHIRKLLMFSVYLKSSCLPAIILNSAFNSSNGGPHSKDLRPGNSAPNCPVW